MAAGVPEYMADLSVFQVLLHHAGLARAVNDLLAAMLFRGRLDPRLRELIIMRIGWATGSDYEWTQHWRIATGLGIDAADVLAVRDWRGDARWTPVERAALAATDATLAGEAVDEATWAECRAALGDDDQSLIEMLAVIGTWQLVSGLLRSLKVPLEDGIASWPPDGAAPPGAV